MRAKFLAVELKIQTELPKIPVFALILVQRWNIYAVWIKLMHKAALMIMMTPALAKDDPIKIKNTILNLSHMLLMAHVGANYPEMYQTEWINELIKAYEGN